MKRMLVNATQEEELRIAMVDGQKLADLDVEVPSREQKKANIYKGRITRIEPSLDAAFVEYGADRHGFLPVKEISPEYFVNGAESGGRGAIRDLIREGQEIVVQVEKEERGNKGAALTTYLSLAGRFLVLMPNNPKAGGVSRRITGEDRDAVRESMQDLVVPEGMGVIVRTAGVGRTSEELQWDTDYLLKVWEAIKASAVERPAPFLIYQESNAVVRALRDHFSSDVGEILVDDEEAYEQARQFMERVMPHNLSKIKLYNDRVPLFTRFQIESQIESAYSHIVELPSGGSIVIDHTEALLSIDINSARATKGDDIESTALNTNLEAAEEIARQLRIRDLGGLIVIDFIDMGPSRNQRDVETRLRESVRADRARVQIGRISRFGLLEMSRQRLRPSLGESSHIVCPRCVGRGSIRSVESLALSVLRLMAEEGRKDRTSKVIAELPIDVATYLLNEKREWIRDVEDREGTQIVIVPRQHLVSPHYQIRRVRDDAMELPENAPVSYQLPESIEAEDDVVTGSDQKAKPEEPAVSGIVPAKPAPAPVSVTQAAQAAPALVPGTPGLWTRIKAFFVGTPGTPETETQGNQAAKPAARQSKPKSARDSGDRRGSSRGGRSRGSRSQSQQRGDRSERPRKTGSGNQSGRAQNSGQDRQGSKGGGRKSQSGQKRQQSRSSGRNTQAAGKGSGASTDQSDQQAQAPAGQVAAQAGEAQSEAPAPRKRRRRRGGRGRRGGQNAGQADRQSAGQGENSAEGGGTSPAQTKNADDSQAANANGQQKPPARETGATPGTGAGAEAPSDKAQENNGPQAGKDEPPPRSRRRRRQRPAPGQTDSGGASPAAETAGGDVKPSPDRGGSADTPPPSRTGSERPDAAPSQPPRARTHGGPGAEAGQNDRTAGASAGPAATSTSKSGSDAPKSQETAPATAEAANKPARADAGNGAKPSASEGKPASPGSSSSVTDPRPPFELSASPAPKPEPGPGAAPSRSSDRSPKPAPDTAPRTKPAASASGSGPVATPREPRPAPDQSANAPRSAPEVSKSAQSVGHAREASVTSSASTSAPRPAPARPVNTPAPVGPVSNPPVSTERPGSHPGSQEKRQAPDSEKPARPSPAAVPPPSSGDGPEEPR